MSQHGENALLAKLKHSLAEKEHNQRFTEVLPSQPRCCIPIFGSIATNGPRRLKYCPATFSPL